MVLKTTRSGIEQKFFELCKKVASEENLDIYDLDYISGSKSLRVFIVNRETKTAVLEDCIKIDKALTPYFEEEDWMPESVMLEVSSPGLFRQLNSIEHFKAVEGQKIALNLSNKLSADEYPDLPKPLTRDKKIIVSLKKTKEDGLEIEAEGFNCFISFENIKKANLESDISDTQ